MSRGINWCFTLNNYEREDEEKIKELYEAGIAKYVVYGREIGENGTRHLQGYVQFKVKKRFGAVKQMDAFTRAHLEIAHGSAEQNVRYCTKDGEYVEFGEYTKRGARTDLAAVKQAIDAGASELEIAEDYFECWVKNYKAFERYRLLKGERIRSKPMVILLIGLTGTGKTRYVFDQPDDRPLYVWADSGTKTVWFDGYDNHERVLFDDFDSNLIPYRLMLRLLDRYPMNVPVKGGYKPWNPKKIFITTNVDPELWYPERDISHLKRRIDQIIKL